MNEVVIFRGKDKKNKWRVGSHIAIGKGNPSQQVHFIEDIEGIRHVIPDHISIGMSSGYTDKNGHYIFDGDICRIVLENGDVIFVTCTYSESFRRVGYGTIFGLSNVHESTEHNSTTVSIRGFGFLVNDYTSFPIVENYCGLHDCEIMTIVGNKYDEKINKNNSL
jgi:hypothetical protein